MQKKGVEKIPGERKGLGSELPIWDRLQMALILLFAIAIVADGVMLFMFRLSTVVINAITFPILFLPALISILIGIYFIRGSHDKVLVTEGEPGFVDTGVYSHVRHPMYLGGILVLLGFLFVELSLVAFAIWVIFFVSANWAATYEERDLERKLGQQYIDYKRKVPKWIPRF